MKWASKGPVANQNKEKTQFMRIFWKNLCVGKSLKSNFSVCAVKLICKLCLQKCIRTLYHTFSIQLTGMNKIKKKAAIESDFLELLVVFVAAIFASKLKVNLA